ncbi:MAG: D-alanine--D-alanine ligase, partial [Pseudomonadota bacterium]
MGGWSAERDVSLATGKACAEALREAGFTQVSEVDVTRVVHSQLDALRPTVAFNALHGPFGEDGTIQGVLEFLQIPYTHSGVLASALAMHKEHAKAILAAAGVPVAAGVELTIEELERSEPLPRPFVLKPVNEGSSVGVFIVRQEDNFSPRQITERPELASVSWMAERYVAGRELTCAMIADQPTGVTEIIPEHGLEFYDYEAKYAQGGSRHVVPAQISPDIYRAIREFTARAHFALGCRGASRADFRLDDTAETPELVCLEVNTQPGMTGTSLVPELAVHGGLSFADLTR